MNIDRLVRHQLRGPPTPFYFVFEDGHALRFDPTHRAAEYRAAAFRPSTTRPGVVVADRAHGSFPRILPADRRTLAEVAAAFARDLASPPVAAEIRGEFLRLPAAPAAVETNWVDPVTYDHVPRHRAHYIRQNAARNGTVRHVYARESLRKILQHGGVSPMTRARFGPEDVLQVF